MDANRKRRGQRLVKPDPEVTAMTDTELLAAYTTGHDEPPAPKPTGSLLQQALRGLTDAELLAEYDAAQAEVHALEAEVRGRETAQPEPVMLPVPSTEPPVEPHPIALEPVSPQPPPVR